MSTTELDAQIRSKYRNRLTDRERQAVIAACASGGVKQDIAKDFGIRPETVSRILRGVKTVQNPSNPLSHTYKSTLKDKAVRAIERGLDAKRDPYAAANIGVKVMSGIGEFSAGLHVDGTVAMQVSWSMPVQAVIESAVSESDIDVQSTAIIGPNASE